MGSPFHDADRPDDPCSNPDCTDCWEEDDYTVTALWWWPWLIALAVAAVAAFLVIATGAPRP